MKKYIRGKNNRIYKVIGITSRYFGWGDDVLLIETRYGGNEKVDFDFVVDEADNIAELCDMFVVAGIKDNYHVVYANDPKQATLQSIVNHLNNNEEEAKLYGAMWTEDGLRYVARFKENEWVMLV